MSACSRCGEVIPGSSPIDALVKWRCADEDACEQRRHRAEIMQDMRDGAMLATAAFLAGRDIDDLWDEITASEGAEKK